MNFLHNGAMEYKPKGHKYSVDYNDRVEHGVVLFTGTNPQEEYDLSLVNGELYNFDPLEAIGASPDRGSSKHIC